MENAPEIPARIEQRNPLELQDIVYHILKMLPSQILRNSTRHVSFRWRQIIADSILKSFIHQRSEGQDFEDFDVIDMKIDSVGLQHRVSHGEITNPNLWHDLPRAYGEVRILGWCDHVILIMMDQNYLAFYDLIKKELHSVTTCSVKCDKRIYGLGFDPLKKVYKVIHICYGLKKCLVAEMKRSCWLCVVPTPEAIVAQCDTRDFVSINCRCFYFDMTENNYILGVDLASLSETTRIPFPWVEGGIENMKSSRFLFEKANTLMMVYSFKDCIKIYTLSKLQWKFERRVNMFENFCRSPEIRSGYPFVTTSVICKYLVCKRAQMSPAVWTCDVNTGEVKQIDNLELSVYDSFIVQRLAPHF